MWSRLIGMNNVLLKVADFVREHHVMSLATTFENELSICSLFYVYDAERRCFVVASSTDTLHMKHIKQNKDVAGNILLETQSIGKIQGLQFRGEFLSLAEKRLKKLYFKRFPYAVAMNPTLYKIEVNFFKLTDNRLGFGKKLIWTEPSL